MEKSSKYFDRELSWLSFNYRVLNEAKSKKLPLYEQIRFLAIYSSNLDEFYRVRVANYRSLFDLSVENMAKLRYDPTKVVSDINAEVTRQQEEYLDYFDKQIIPSLEKIGIVLYQNEILANEQVEFVNEYFSREVLPNIQAVLLTTGDVLSFLQDNVIYLAIELEKKRKKKSKKKNKKKTYAIIKIPTHHLPRFIELPKCNEKYYIIFLEDIIRLNLNILFPGYNLIDSYSIKLSRNADLAIEDEFKGNLVNKIKLNLSKRKTGAPSRFIYDSKIPRKFLSVLKQAFNLSKEDLMPAGRYHNLSDLFDFPNPLVPQFELPRNIPLAHRELDLAPSILKAVKEKDIMLHFPYQSYNYVIRFFNEAAIDHKVEEIKTTQYRVATNSAIVSALISAARNGKRVSVFVEVKARFDEEANLKFAEQMRQAGIKIIPSIPGLKVHSKAALVIRRNSTKEGKQRGYAFLSTGNFNEKTAKLYADHGFFTSNEEIVDDVREMFEYLETPAGNDFKFRHLWVPKFNFRTEFKKRIEREIKHVQDGKKGYVLLKMNSLEDRKMIDLLYVASQAGVVIDLIIRGICRLVPKKEFSENIRVIRIVDKYLEHARIFVFYNNGLNETYISSADLMHRNLNRRVEAAIPIFNEQIKKDLLEILTIQLKDNVKACLLGDECENISIVNSEPKVRAQIAIEQFLLNKKY